MKQFILLFGLSFAVLGCDNQSTKEIVDDVKLVENNTENDSIPKESANEQTPQSTNSTTEKYTITFAEWQDKSTNKTCIVIRQDSLFTIINDGSINGKKNEVLASGILRIHKRTGKTILTKKLEDINASEIGGCSDGPTVVDLKNKIIEFC